MSLLKTIAQVVFIASFLISPTYKVEVNIESDSSLPTLGWGFKKNQNHQVPDIGSYESEISDTNAFYYDSKNPHKIYLTFDAGYDNGNLPKILDMLKAKGVKATIFVTGDFVKRFPDLLRRIVNEGHIVGNHSFAHKNIAKISEEVMFEDIERLENAYYETTGEKMAKIFRPPEGSFTKEKLRLLSDRGYRTYFWSLAYCDWDVNKQYPVNKTIEVVLQNIHPGAIILMHSVSSSNQEALPVIIDKLLDMNYQFGTLNEVA